MRKIFAVLVMVFGLALSAFAKEVAIVNHTGGTIFIFTPNEDGMMADSFYKIVSDNGYTVLSLPDGQTFAVGFFFNPKTGQWTGGTWGGIEDSVAFVEFTYDRKQKVPMGNFIDRENVVVVPAIN